MFGEKIISWYLLNKRDLPWRNTKNPYKIWLSEIILQQTRVAQGMPYYYKFIETFKDIDQLAEADEGEVLRLWQGLGYYSRGRNLHKTAKIIKNEFNSRFPQSFEALQKLKGIGPYTAAAIASFAFDEKVAAIDGNALRVISRYFEIKEAIDLPKTHKVIFEISNDLIANVDAGLYNQAVMDLGATICLPKSPLCNQCPVSIGCKARLNNTILQIPLKEKKVKVKNRFFLYIVYEFENTYWLKKRSENDIWANMFDFYLLESDPESENLEEIIQELLKSHLFEIKEFSISESFIHILTHQRIKVTFITIKCVTKPKIADGAFYELSEIETMAKPKVIADYFKNEDN